ncbi:tetratricopeptide repeat protein [Pelagibius sp.]|uniref:tetratricopeptide repeat protein n=1 Tax=Pelagibius sp. TaxID=1931238 RepID=UPI003BAF0B01
MKLPALPILGLTLFCLFAGPQVAAAGGSEPEDAEDAAIAQLFEDCEAGDMQACFRLGARYDEGYGVDEDLVQAAAYYRRACDGGSAAGCYGLASKYQLGEGVERDQARADQLLRQACEGGLALACDSVPPPLQEGG